MSDYKGCGHDGWVAGCPKCEREYRLAQERLGIPELSQELAAILSSARDALVRAEEAEDMNDMLAARRLASVRLTRALQLLEGTP